MKKLLGIIVLVIILGAGLYILKANEPEEILLNDYKCNINGVDYYVHNPMIYFLSNDGLEYIYTEFGVYQRKETKDGWILKFHRNKFKSIYVEVLKWIDEGNHPTAGKVNCESFEEYPEGFKVFVDGHGMIFKQMKEDFKELEEPIISDDPEES